MPHWDDLVKFLVPLLEIAVAFISEGLVKLNPALLPKG